MNHSSDSGPSRAPHAEGVQQVAREQGIFEMLYIPAIAGGIATTVRHFFKNVFSKDNYISTIQYPDQKVVYPPRFRGMHRLVQREDGKPRCVACFMCQTACPARCIHIEAGETDDKRIEKFPVVFRIDELRCVVCGLCVEACPCDAIRMDTGTHAKPVEHRVDAILGRFDLMNLTKTTSKAHQGGLGGDWREEQPSSRETMQANKPDLTPVSPMHVSRPQADVIPPDERPARGVAAAAAGGNGDQ